MIFDEEAVSCCSNIIANALSVKQEAKKLYQNWLRNGLVNDSDSFQDVFSNKPLMTLLLHNLAEGLPKEASTSQYGRFFVSDHDLYFRCKTDFQLSNFLREKALTHLNVNDTSSIKSGRLALLKSMTRLRDTVLMDMELVGTHDPTEKKTLPTAKAVIKKAEKKARDTKKRKPVCDEEIEEDEEENEEEENKEEENEEEEGEKVEQTKRSNINFDYQSSIYFIFIRKHREERQVC
jgi:hypothetical protein